MRDPRLDEDTWRKAHSVEGFGAIVEGIGWVVIGFGIIIGFGLMIYSNGDTHPLVLTAIFEMVNAGIFGIILVLLGRSAVMNALAIKGNLVDTGTVRQAVSGRPEAPRLGINVAARGDEPAVVSSVVPGSPADLAGARAGDLIVAVQDIENPTVQQLATLIGETPPGTSLGFVFKREGQVLGKTWITLN